MYGLLSAIIIEIGLVGQCEDLMWAEVEFFKDFDAGI